jgi:hypothetical protein
MSDHVALTAALASLVTLKRQFETGAEQYPLLNHLLVEAPEDQRDTLRGPFPIEGCRTPEQAIGCSSGLFELLARSRTPDERGERFYALNRHDVLQERLLYIAGPSPSEEMLRHYMAGRDSFLDVAERAGECLRCLPADVLDVVPADVVAFRDRVFGPGPAFERKGFDALLPPGRGPDDRWVSFIYWLAWRTDTGSPLRAKRRTWIGNVTAPWAATREDLERQMGPGPWTEAFFTYENTRHYFSILKNVFLWSILAIDAIEAGMGQGRAKARAEPPAAAVSPPVVVPTNEDGRQPEAPPGVDPVTELRKKKRRIPAALVEFMRDRESAEFEDIAQYVHGDSLTSEGAIRKNVERTNNYLIEMRSRLNFITRSSRVYKQESPQ